MSASNPAPLVVLTPREVRIVRAIGKALFPRDKNVDVDAIDVGVSRYIDDWMSRCGTAERAQFHALLNAFDAGYPVWARDPSLRLEAARREDRRAYMESWERSQIYLQRMLWEGLRSMFLFAYVDADAVREAIGQSPVTSHVDPVAAPAHREEAEQVARFAGGGCGARSLPKEG